MTFFVPAPPTLVDFVVPHPSVSGPAIRFAYLNDWQGEGDIKLATILDDYSPEVGVWNGYAIHWEAVDHNDTRFYVPNFHTLAEAQDYITEHALLWAEAYASSISES